MTPKEMYEERLKEKIDYLDLMARFFISLSVVIFLSWEKDIQTNMVTYGFEYRIAIMLFVFVMGILVGGKMAKTLMK